MLQGMKSVWWQRPKWRETATSQGMPAIVSNASSQETGVEPTLSSKPPKKPILSTPWFQISSLQNADRINCCCFKPLSLCNLWQQLWEAHPQPFHPLLLALNVAFGKTLPELPAPALVTYLQHVLLFLSLVLVTLCHSLSDAPSDNVYALGHPCCSLHVPSLCIQGESSSLTDTNFLYLNPSVS